MNRAPALPTQWVAAAPFRYHVQHLIAATGVPWQMVAIVAELPQQQVRTLLYGRAGRRRPRLSPYAARRLLAVTQEQLLTLRTQLAPASLVRDNLAALLEDGVTVEALAAWLHLDVGRVAQLAHGAGTCTVITGAMLRLACVERGLLHEAESKAAA
jgi:hypothetical protein